jgi:hypothetical protein
MTKSLFSLLQIQFAKRPEGVGNFLLIPTEDKNPITFLIYHLFRYINNFNTKEHLLNTIRYLTINKKHESKKLLNETKEYIEFIKNTLSFKNHAKYTEEFSQFPLVLYKDETDENNISMIYFFSPENKKTYSYKDFQDGIHKEIINYLKFKLNNEFNN